MHPKLLEIPLVGLPIYSYGLMVMLGFLAAIFVSSRRARKENINPELIFDIGLIGMIAGIIGARIAYLTIYANQFKWHVFNIFDGNLDTLGAIIGWFIPFAVYFLKKSIRFTQDKPKQQANQKQTTKPRFQFLTFIKLLGLSIISAVICARIFYLAGNSGKYDWGIFYIWRGGLVFYGGLILAIISGIIYLKIKKVSVLKVSDIVAPAIMLGEALGRVGCFLNGCCYGALCHLPWAVQFPKDSPAYDEHIRQDLIAKDASTSLPIHPSQVYSSLAALILFVILSLMWRKRKKDGMVLGFLGVLYPFSRFMIEFIRGDNPHLLFGLTISQLISVVVLLISVIFLIRLTVKPSKTNPSAVSPIASGRTYKPAQPS